MTWVSHKRKCDNLKDLSNLLDFKVPLSIDIFFGQLNRLGTVERQKIKFELKNRFEIWNEFFNETQHDLKLMLVHI